VNHVDQNSEALLRDLGARFREQAFSERQANAIAARLLAPPTAKPLPKAKVLRLRKLHVAAAPLALAAGIALFLGTRSSTDVLPEYDLVVVGAKATRAANDAPVAKQDVTLDPQGDFELVARPAVPTRDVHPKVMLVRDGTSQPWSAPLAVSADGAVKISGANKALFPETRGAYEIIVVLGPSRSVQTRVHFSE